MNHELFLSPGFRGCFRCLSLRSLAAALVLLLALVSPSGLRAEDAFGLPNLEAKLFDGKKLDFGRRAEFDRVGMVSALARVASDFDPEEDGVSNELRSQALGLAGMIDPKNKAFQQTYDALKANPNGAAKGNSTKSRLAGNILRGVEHLRKDKGNEDNRKCAAYCADLILRLDPGHEKAGALEELRDSAREAGIALDWDKLRGKSVPRPGPGPEPFPWPFPRPADRMKEREGMMPGGTAAEFARTQSSVIALVVRDIGGGKQAGSASKITATAFEEKVEGLHFRINQKVGESMANSLDSVTQFMRNKYRKQGGRVPDAWEVKIVFEDRDALTDGPSAGTALALLVDSLFSGSAIDPDFACTGGITTDGDILRIGGVAAKIRGATHRKCRIVGVPEGNAQGVRDIIVLGGVQQLLDIQIFTMRNFEEALAISRAEKGKEFSAVLEAFEKIAAAVDASGIGALKHPSTRSRLKAIVDAAPNHLSAKLLLDHADGKAPRELSAGRSYTEVQSRFSTLLMRPEFGMLLRGRYDHGDALVAQAGESLGELRELETHLQDEFKPYLRSTMAICEMVKRGKGDRSEKEFVEGLRKEFTNLEALSRKLGSNPEIREEIGG